ncbi:MAG: hypothetical protein J6K89_01065 [Oscillospiraceae bacterium]|nr:hypothetical protein [Oscillospiraceae bacterium]
MKKAWKIGIAAAAFVAGLIPFYRKEDKETGASVQQALFWCRSKKPGGETSLSIGLHLGLMPLPGADEEDTEALAEEIAEEVTDTVEEALPEIEEIPAEVL